MMCLPATRVWSGRLGSRVAFTIIELLTVMAIILVLAGLVLGIAGHAQDKAARSRAQAEIQAMSAGANNYQIDNGAYPRIPSGTSATITTDKIDPRNTNAAANYDPASGTSPNVDPNYTTASLILYKCLSGVWYYDPSAADGKFFTVWTSSSKDSAGNAIPKPTTYFPFTDSQLKNSAGLTSGYIDPTTISAVVDPFGFSYGYSTIYQSDVDSNAAANPPITTPPTRGYNPTYDFWSTAGYSPSAGKAYPSTAPSVSTYDTFWVKNW